MFECYQLSDYATIRFQAVEDVVVETFRKTASAIFAEVQPANRQTFVSASKTTTEDVVCAEYNKHDQI